MAPRANWKGYLRLSLVSCPIALFPATSEREKIRFHQNAARALECRERHRRAGRRRRRKEEYEEMYEEFKAA
jgi:non-homologous end joining protein Ku